MDDDGGGGWDDGSDAMFVVLVCDSWFGVAVVKVRSWLLPWRDCCNVFL